MQTIIVRPKSGPSGQAQRVAKGMGKQRTTPLDFAQSDDWNLGNAAGILGLVLGWKPTDNITRGQQGEFFNHTR